MKYIVDGDIVWSHPPDGPLAAEMNAFAEWAREQGYARYSRYRNGLLASCFSRWLKKQAIRLRGISSEHTSRYLRSRARRVRRRKGDAAALTAFLEFLRRRDILRAEPRPSPRVTAVERTTQAFAQYLQHARALAPATVVHDLPFIHRFLTDRFGHGPVRLSRLRARAVARFVQRQAPRVHVKEAKVFTTALRSFLHYARARGDTALDLAAAVPSVANWSMSSIPRAIPAESVRRLLASIDRRTTRGRRDYAILLLLARLGLRASEVAWLELDDLDWSTGQITVRGKRGRITALPLPADAGAAIAAYLRHGRPRSTSRRVFLRAHAPNGGFAGPSAIACVVRYRLERAGLPAPTKGAHQFRHALATQMLHDGASLTEIGEILRHCSPETTMIYAKVDLDALADAGVAVARRCAMTTLRSAVQQYLAMRRSLGFHLSEAGRLLPQFVTFMEQHRASVVTTPLALAWAQQSQTVQPAERARRLSIVRIFARYHQATDPRTEIPPDGMLPYRPKRAHPYLYSDDEIQRLLRAARTLPARGGFRPWAYHGLFGLLSVSGLRLGEARNLRVDDVDLDAGVLTVRHAKFGKSRLVPLHASTGKVLAAYLARRRRHWAGRPVSPYVFVSNWGNRLDVGSVHRTFYALSRQIGLRKLSDHRGPRIHDLRHRFAAKTLWRWYHTGEDPERRMPILSAYLGHVHVRDTYWYLSAWPELMREVMRRLERRWEDRR